MAQFATEAMFQELKNELKQKNLFRKRTKFYLDYFVIAFTGVLLGLYIITLSDSIIIQSLNGIFLGVVFMQIGFIGHDACHGQIFKSKWANRLLGKFCFGITLGISEDHWYKQHNTHHKEVNHATHDPDLDIPFIFDKHQSIDCLSWAMRKILPYQHYIFFLSMPVWALSKLSRVFIDNLIDMSWRGFGEIVISIIHFSILFYLLFTYLSPLTILFFLAAHFATTGFYMGLAFAPNHKGEEMIPEDGKISWINQITSTRNLHMNKLIYHATGGLNLQIEHHLFPYMPRANYPDAQPIVKDFCRKYNIEYSEMTLLESLKEIYTVLKANSTRLNV